MTKKSKDTPDLRAIGVLEWTGDEGKPKTSRLVPITVYDGQALQDGNVYLARPQPMALASEVEYQLEKNGQPIGLYDIKHAGQEQGLWVGYGAWKPLPSAKLATPKAVVDDGFNPDDDKPVLHRKHSDASSKPGSNSARSLTQARLGKRLIPTGLHCTRRPSTHDSSDSTTRPPADPDQPTIQKKDSGDASSASSTKAAIPTGPCSTKAPSPQPIRATGSISAAPILTARTFFAANRPAMERTFCPP